MKFLSEAAIQVFIEANKESLARVSRSRQQSDLHSDALAPLAAEKEAERQMLERLLRLCEPMECPECGKEIEE